MQHGVFKLLVERLDTGDVITMEQVFVQLLIIVLIILYLVLHPLVRAMWFFPYLTLIVGVV